MHCYRVYTILPELS